MYIYGATLAILFYVVKADQPNCVAGKYQIIPKLDCTGYFLCVFGKPVEMPDCPPGSAFSTTAHVCVPKNSIYDDCKLNVMPTVPDLGKNFHIIIVTQADTFKHFPNITIIIVKVFLSILK